MNSDTTDPSYWLNWRFLLCSLWVLCSVVLASILIWKYEGSGRKDLEGGGETELAKMGILYEDEAWRPCLRTIHPVWLLAFRAIAFLIFLALSVVNTVLNGSSVLYYYTEWTLTLLTVYFGLGSLLSAYGCHQYMSEACVDRTDCIKTNLECGLSIAPVNGGTTNGHHTMENPVVQVCQKNQRTAGFSGYLFQVIYQTNAGAVILTDLVFWLVIFPFQGGKDNDLDFMDIGLHTINVVFLLGDTTLNSLQFPWFRISYFMLWTSIYVIFQWILHGCISIWWPYSFLNLSSPSAPIWYFGVAVMHVPCYAIFSLLVKLKHSLLMRWFPQSCNLANESCNGVK